MDRNFKIETYFSFMFFQPHFSSTLIVLSFPIYDTVHIDPAHFSKEILDSYK